MDRLISIILPVYNVEQYIADCMESLASQDDKNFELLVIDDGSSDSSIDIVTSYLDKFNKVRIQKQKNKGLGGARNTGIKLAQGDFITFVDSDDYISSNYISSLRKRQNIEQSDVVTGQIFKVIDGKIIDLVQKDPNNNIQLNEVEKVLGAYRLSVSCTRLYRRSIVINYGIRFPEHIPHEDWFFTYKVLKNSNTISVEEKAKYFWRQRKNSLGQSISKNHIDVVPNLRNDTNIFLRNHSATEKELACAARRNLLILGVFRNKIDMCNQEDLNNYFSRMIQNNQTNIIQDIVFFENSQIKDTNLIKRVEKILNDSGVNIEKTRKSLKSKTLPSIDIAFFPLREYHLNDCLSVIKGLRRDGINAEIIETDEWRNGNDEVKLASKEQAIEITNFEDFIKLNINVSAIVMWNDWDLLMRILSQACHDVGTETIGWVEGIQDYHEVDRIDRRYPYSRSKNVILPGEYDTRYFTNTAQNIFVGEVVRIKSLWLSRMQKKNNNYPLKVLINSNFSYGVLEEHRDKWIDQAVKACIKNGCKPIISRHPFDNGNSYSHYQTNKSFFDIIKECDVSIHRFASGILESLAMGIPVIYFNPHREKVDKFTSPNGAYQISYNQQDLELILLNRNFFWDETTAKSFLELHAGLNENFFNTSDSKTLYIIHEILKNTKTPLAPLTNKLRNISPPKNIKELRQISLTIGPIYIEDDSQKNIDKAKYFRPKLFTDEKNNCSKAHHSSFICLVIGNGPSLKNLNFFDFKETPNIGMNIAFKHWKRIGWYPSYYICLDTVVTASQKDGIFRLVKDQGKNGIRFFMLRKNILEFYPSLKRNPSVLFFDDYLKAPIFDGAVPISTGSHAALFAAMLGYKKICLLGIDCDYVQQLPEAKNIKDHVLEMTRTPEKNPNYFIDDYQEIGDRFNIPNSLPNLHYNSWIAVKERLEKLGVDVVNCNSQSRLDMFDFVDLKDILS